MGGRPSVCCYCVPLVKGGLVIAGINVVSSILFILLGGIGVGMLPEYPAFFAELRRSIRLQYERGEIYVNEYDNMLGYVAILEGCMFNIALASLLIAVLWFVFNLAMLLGILCKRSRWMIPFLVVVALLIVTCGLLVIIGSIWMMTSKDLIGYGFMFLIIGFPIVTIPTYYNYYVIYSLFKNIRDEEMMENGEYIPSLVLEPLPNTGGPNVVHVNQDYQRF